MSDQYIKCPECGTEHSQANARCTICGAGLPILQNMLNQPTNQLPTNHSSVKCYKCGTEIINNEIVYCPKCGTCVRENFTEEVIKEPLISKVAKTLISKIPKISAPKLPTILIIIAGLIATLVIAQVVYINLHDAPVSKFSNKPKVTSTKKPSSGEKTKYSVPTHKPSHKPQEVKVDEDEYLYPSKWSRIDEGYLNTLTRKEIAYIRNEIYARHGYVFQSKEYQDYFSRQSWYDPDPTIVTGTIEMYYLNDTELYNIKTITAYEKKKGWR